MDASIVPLSLKKRGDGLDIEWNDGLRQSISWRDLRKACPCASCIEERNLPPNPFKILSPTELSVGSPEPVAMAARGYYAYQITWNDGHDTGIYTLEYLREIGSEAAPT